MRTVWMDFWRESVAPRARKPLYTDLIKWADRPRLLSGDAGSAEVSFNRALAIRKQTIPATHAELLIAQVRLAQAFLAECCFEQVLDQMRPVLASARATPFPLPLWRMAELEIVNALALRGMGRHKEEARLIARNRSTPQRYNHAAVRDYLMAQHCRTPSNRQVDNASNIILGKISGGCFFDSASRVHAVNIAALILSGA